MKPSPERAASDSKESAALMAALREFLEWCEKVKKSQWNEGFNGESIGTEGAQRKMKRLLKEHNVSLEEKEEK